MMKNLFFLLLVLSTGQSYAQNYAADQVPAQLKVRANATIRDMETVTDMRAVDQVIVSTRKAVTVWNKNGDPKAALFIYYDKSTSIQRIKGQVLDAAGNLIQKITQSNFSDESAVSSGSLFVGYRLKYFQPAINTYPYTVVYEYEVKNKQNLMIPEWYANPYPDESVEKNTYTFISKPNDEIRIKAYNYTGEPVIVKSEKNTSYTWTANNKAAFKQEPYAPDPDNFSTHVKIAAKQFSYYGYKGSYKDWNELGKWVYNDLIKDRQALPETVVQEMKELVKGLDSDKEKAKKIYEYLQKKTRYISVQIGIGGFQPMQATEVQQLSYGDCKALVNYMQSLLKAVDIPSFYCVVNAGNIRKDMDPDFASMEQGNHIILCLPLKTDSVWLECTSTDSPFGFLGDFTDNRTVFACTAEGGKLLRTPDLSTTENLLQRKAELTADKEGNITGQLKTVFSGAQYDNYQNLIGEPYTEQLKLLKRKYDIDNINFSDFKMTQDKSVQPTATESLKLEIPNYAAKNGNRFYLDLNAFNKIQSVPELRTRTLPLYINRGFTDEDELVYQLPEGYVLEARPDDKLISSPFGSYSATIKIEGRKLSYKRKFVLKNGTYPATQYADFSTFMSNVNSSDRSRLIYKLN